MYFDFSDEQYALRDGAREFFRGEVTPGYLRSRWEAGGEHDPALWKKMAETGFIGLTVPEEHGGLGMDAVDLVLLLEEAGYVAVPGPFVETTAIAAPLLAEFATQAQRDEWLPRIASGDAVVSVSLEGAGLPVAADVADLLLLERDGALHAVPRERFRARVQPSMDHARRVCTVDADLDDTTRIGGPDSTRAAFDRGAAATAAFLNGLSQRMLDATVAYVKERHQFGRPVGSFQAVKHLLADIVLVVETAKAAGWYAALAIARDMGDRSQAASVAKAYASDAEATANFGSLQAHGGIGFTWEHDLHLYLKRGKALEQAYGSAAAHRRRLAANLFDRTPSAP